MTMLGNALFSSAQQPLLACLFGRPEQWFHVNLKQVRAYAGSPIFEELRLIVLKTFGGVEVLRSALSPLASEVKFAFVFCSVAQGSDRASSDIDVMLTSETLSYGQIMAALEPAEKQLGRAVQITQYTLDEFIERKRKHHPFLAEVLRQPKLMVIGTEDDIDSIG